MVINSQCFIHFSNLHLHANMLNKPLSLSFSSSRLRLSPSPPPTRSVTVTRSSGSGSHTRVVQSSSTRTASGSSKKRRLNDNDSDASSVVGGTITRTRVSQQASASGRVTVDEVDMEGKYVRLSNKSDQVRETHTHLNGQFKSINHQSFSGIVLNHLHFFSSTQDQTLGHWQVKRQIGSGTPIIYKFPPKFTLKAGQTVTVSSDLQP